MNVNSAIDASIILDFIKRRFPVESADWAANNDYWFANLLTQRFSNLRIYYQPETHKFFAGSDDDLIFYDCLGMHNIVDLSPPPMLFSDVAGSDPQLNQAIIQSKIL